MKAKEETAERVVTCRLPVPLYRQAKVRAANDDKSMTQLMVLAVDFYLKKNPAVPA